MNNPQKPIKVYVPVDVAFDENGHMSPRLIHWEDGKTYEVYNAEGLKNIAELVNEEWKLDINITLTNNIDLTGIDWTPIGKDDNKAYTGTFDGGGHTITGLTFTTNDEYAGLFGWLNRAGTVKNVVMEGVQITSNQIS